MRGVRLNLGAGQTDPAAGRRRFQALSGLVKRLGLHIQIYTSLAVMSRIKDFVQDSPMPVVFDHFGGLQPRSGLNQPGFADLSTWSVRVKLMSKFPPPIGHPARHRTTRISCLLPGR